jgi:hypothetical protein
MKTNRRNILAMGGGAMAGLVFTPVPWKLLDDSSIWTQNWPWIPQPARGPVEVKAAACGLCPHGCAMRVKMAAGYPVGIASAPGGALCPLAFGAHQLNWHPRRVREVRHRGKSATWAEAKAAFEKACAEGPVMVVDGRPGRAASAILREFGKKHGAYVVAHGAEDRGLAPYAAWSGVPAELLGYDLESARTVVSFGAPLLDGWGAPGRFAKQWSARAAGSGDPELRLIQIEPMLSRTASASWRWVSARPGSDAVLAGALARVMLEERLVAAKGPMPEVTAEAASRESGLPEAAIAELARTIASRTPALAISSCAQPAVAALNLVLGTGVVQRSGESERPGAVEKARAIVVDASVPWDYELAPGAEVFRFAAWDGGTAPDWLLPAPGFLEELTDHPAAPASQTASYALSPELVAPAKDVSSAAGFLGGSIKDQIGARCEAIFRARAGTLHRRGSAEPVKVAAVESAAKLQEELLAGAVWVDDAANTRRVRCELREWPVERAIPRRAHWAAAWSAPVLPPLAGKLFQESELREAPARSRI